MKSMVFIMSSRRIYWIGNENTRQWKFGSGLRNADFLQSLFANDLSLLKQLEQQFSVKVVTRDAWLKLEGSLENVMNAKSVFGILESVRRKGGQITTHTFRLAMEHGQAGGSSERGRGGELIVGKLDPGGRQWNCGYEVECE